MRPLVAHCRFSLGKLRGRVGDRQTTEHLTTAMSLFNEMGMRFWFEKAEAEMHALEGAGVPGNHAREQGQRRPATLH